ncbi:amidohydrolase [Hafnia paralvei]|uniref:amidohydrolase family protein n=1 Tax=Hafnia paralvei TaxID=546367 RepID=UPI000DF12FD1|nr:amidohydrolase family protein [Hafnia paralvei]RDA66054.1 amidohydrolase [Hafnia paralvei]RDA66621.1 amidohydrolase [Hafnia paralvei]RDA66943.1 amidohydrolase [Hafnia paralvei]RDA77343.1 amidohydrolase [Hafnia paralvei]RDA78067.1 amidohydrolase [Hafnia paralvei]
MKIIDTHNHLWVCEGEHFEWITADLEAIRRDFTIEDLIDVLEGHQVEGAILVQAVPQLEESEWLLRIAADTPQIKGVVGWADMTKGQRVGSDLDRLISQSNKLKGIRYMSQGLPAEHLIDPDFIDGVRCVGERGLVYELLITPSQLACVAQLISQCPDTTFVIEHCAKPIIRECLIEEWQEGIRFIGQRYSNVYCKLSGIATEANYGCWKDQDQAYKDLEPYIDAVFNAFGDRRVMFGSDWPVSLLALHYADIVSLCQRYLKSHPHYSMEQFYHAVAEHVYSLK